MNRRGYTFIELLGVIVLLGIILVIGIPSITNALRTSRINSEKVFLDKLSDTIDSYVSTHSNDFKYDYVNDGTKTTNRGNSTVKIYRARINETEINMQNIIDDKLIDSVDFKDPAFSTPCNQNAIVEIYRDSDYVYCHKIRVEDLNCLSDDYKEELQDDVYAIDTCIWQYAEAILR